MKHDAPHALAGRTVVLKADFKGGDADPAPGSEYELEDWWDRLTGGSWMDAEGNPAALKYAFRSGLLAQLPLDNEVVYGHVNGFGHLVHVSEIEHPEAGA